MYELYLLLDPKYTKENIESRVQKIIAAFGQRGIQLSKEKEEQSKTLAYPINTKTKAHALLFTATTEPGVDIEKVAQELLDTQEDILRRLVFKKEKKQIKKEEDSVLDQLRKKRSSQKEQKKSTATADNQQSKKKTKKEATSSQKEETKQKEPDTAEIDKKLEELLQ